MISIFIPTKNEALDLPGCLDSVRWSDDIHVYDSGSTDATAAIARAAGAHVTVGEGNSSQEIFGGDEASHKNWALQHLPFKYEWVLHLDADERVAPELVEQARCAVAQPMKNVAFRIRRRDFWGQTWMKHVVQSSYYMRLFRPEKLNFARLINPVPVPDGPVGELNGYLDHYPFSKGVEHWLNRHNSYSSLEARQIVSNRPSQRDFQWTRAFCAADFNERRLHQKQLFYRLPARPLLKFLLLYVGKRGFLDGSAGFRYAMLQSFYEFMIVLKTKELVEKNELTARSASLAKTRSIKLENLSAERGPDE
jgi:glycosyltransferase involved in cell wall biosynthesis